MAFSAISIDNGFPVSNVQIIMVTIPARIIGILAAVAYSWNRGLDLDKDPKFQAKLRDPQQYAYIYGSNATTLNKKIPQSSKNAVYIFLGTLAVIVVISITQMFGLNILPSYKNISAVSHVESARFTELSVDTVRVKSYVMNGKDTL